MYYVFISDTLGYGKNFKFSYSVRINSFMLYDWFIRLLKKKINNFHLNILHNFLIYLLWQLWLWCIAVGKFTTVWRIIMSLRRVCTKYFLNLILAMFLLAKLNLIFLKLQCIGTLIFFRIPCKGHNDNPDNALPIYGTKKPLWIDT